MAKILLARGSRGEIVRKVQRQLQSLSFDPQGIDGRYGNNTDEAVSKFQQSHDLEPTGEVDVATWARLMSIPPPSVKDRSLQITAAFEGHDFTLAEGNYDGAGITWGVIGFTLLHGELVKIILDIQKSNPDLVSQAFGAKTDELISVMNSSKARQIAFADSISLGSDKVKLAEPWRSAFEKFGEIPEVQALQLELADRDYFQPALQSAQDYGLKAELGLALMMDTHVQNGGISPSIRERIAKDLAQHSVKSEQELRVIIANAVADDAKAEFREDVRARKLTIATGAGRVHQEIFLLYAWGLDESPFEQN
ncbi:MAG: peptidoglycan-binding protein [Blastocatellia bacterium]|nr:peptidoglycan-binding protein [Blastocatellia bacterium]